MILLPGEHEIQWNLDKEDILGIERWQKTHFEHVGEFPTVGPNMFLVHSIADDEHLCDHRVVVGGELRE
jgi:hypothetical protein